MFGYRYLATAVIGLAVVLSAGGVPVHAAATAADLFDLNTIHEIRIRMNTRDMAAMLGDPESNTHYTAMFQWRDIKLFNVSVRMRGAGSRTPQKPPLQIDFARYATRQRFLGLSSLSLDNHWQDAAMFRERTSMSFFNRMGQPAVREAATKVYFNDIYYGLFTVIENVDLGYVARVYGDVVGRTNPGSFLTEYHNIGPYYFTDLGTMDAFKVKFEARSRETEADITLYGPLIDFVKEANKPVDAVWRSRVEQYLDVNQFVKYVAIENFLTEWDGFTGQWGMNNFYLYRTANSTKFQIVPWDADFTFTYWNAGIFERKDENVLFSKLIAFSDLRTLYLDVMEQCAKSAKQDNWLLNFATAQAALVKDTMHGDPKKLRTNEFSDQDTEALLDWIRFRPDWVLGLVAQARLAPAAGR